ncbi:DNA polymerase III subunit epsilon [Rhodobacteraceae bacterium WD3A24]|nr:DNA polymerase III subunit epsilon [Rhodobacteraceae bacterium WD3A24]
MREIVLDTETTGFEPEEGHRIVEIGAVEMANHMPTRRVFHKYLDPQRPMPNEAFEVHGLGDDFLRGQPLFEQIAEEFMEFVGDARLVIHNAAFDMKFLNFELGRTGRPVLPMERALDTLALARRRFPGAPASLDALCRRFGIDNAAREKHGALLDSEILAEVYLELIGGRQPDFGLGPSISVQAQTPGEAATGWRPRRRPEPLPSRITEAEARAHARLVEALGEGAVWRRYL